MRYPLLLALTVWSLKTIGQPYFQKVYAAGSGGKFSLVELASGNVLTILSNSESINESGTSILDTGGSVFYSRCYEIDTFLVLQSVKKLSNNELRFVGGYYKNSCPGGGLRIYPSAGRMDSLGNRLDMMYYELNGGACTNLAGDLTLTSDSGALLWGRDNRLFVVKVAQDLSPLWAKRFNRNGSVRFLKELPSGDLIAGFDTDTAGASIARLNADGDILWCKSYMRPLGTFHDAVIAPDGSITCIGFTRAMPNRLFMLKIDGAGSVEWCRGYESVMDGWALEPMQIEKTLDDNYIILSTIRHSGSSSYNKPLLFKTNPNGDTLWTRTLGSTDYNYYTADLLAASDGCFWFSGGIEGDLPDQQSGLPQIVKADPEGHFSCQEQPHPMVIQDLFPTDSSFTMVSIDGVVAYPAYVNDTAFDPITTYDACVITSLPSVRSLRKPVLRPNPNSGRFSVEFPDPLLSESYYSLFDTMGKLLLQRPLPTGATLEEVDLTRFGAGSYVIKFTSPDGVCYERVVVE